MVCDLREVESSILHVIEACVAKGQIYALRLFGLEHGVNLIVKV